MKALHALILCTTLALPITTVDAAPKKASAEQCRKWQQQLDKVNAELRAGYKTERGNKLRKRRLALQTKLRRRCRK
ncbi:hypothetical protein ACVBEJ_06955 [Porticoccus sp. GXU_MW_L64]